MIAITVLAAAAFAAMGLAALLRPALVTGLVGVAEPGADLRNEVRAVYGGFGLMVGALLLATLAHPALGPGVRFAVALSLLGMAAGRLMSWAMERSGRWPRVFFVVELALGGALLAAARFS